MKEIKLLIREGIDCLGVFAINDGKLYAKWGECDFQEDAYIENKCRKKISQALLNGLELTIKSGLRVEKLFYEKIPKRS